MPSRREDGGAEGKTRKKKLIDREDLDRIIESRKTSEVVPDVEKPIT